MYLYEFNVLEHVVRQIFVYFNLFFETIMQVYVIPNIEFMMSVVFGGIARLFYLLLMAVMALLDLLQWAASALSGGRKVAYNGQEDYFINVLLYRSGLSRVIWAIVLIAMSIGVLFSIVSMTGAMRSDEKGKTVKVLLKTAKTMLMFLIVPAMCIAAINISMLLFEKTGEMVSVANGRTEEPKISSSVFLMATAGAERDWGFFTRSAAYNYKNEARYQYIEGHANGRYYWNLIMIDLDFTMYKMQFFPAVIAAVFFIFVYLSLAAVFVYFIFQILLLFAVAPFFVAPMIFDDGQMFKKWRDLFLTRLIAGLGLITSVRLYEVIIIPMFTSDTFRFFPVVPAVSNIIGPEYFPDTYIKMFFLLLFGRAVTKSHTIVTHIINENAAQEEQQVADFAKKAAVAAAKKAGELAVDAAMVAAAVVAGIFTAGAGGAAVGGAGLGAKAGGIAAKTAVKTGAKAAVKVGQAAAKRGMKAVAKKAGKQIAKQAGSRIKDKAINKGAGALSDIAGKGMGGEEQ